MSTLNIPQQKGNGIYIVIFVVLLIGSFLIYPLLFAKQEQGDRAQGRRITGSRSCRHTSETCDTTVISRVFEARKIREVKCTCNRCGKIRKSTF